MACSSNIVTNGSGAGGSSGAGQAGATALPTAGRTSANAGTAGAVTSSNGAAAGTAPASGSSTGAAGATNAAAGTSSVAQAGGGATATGGSATATGGSASGGVTSGTTSALGCTPGPLRCDGQTPVVCSATGVEEHSAACANKTCINGVCQGVCAPTQTSCGGNTPRTCDASGQWVLGTPCPEDTPVCASGVCQVGGPSCSGLAANCGASGNQNCCASSIVTGDTFNRNGNAALPATISNFKLDRFEVTIGRFRKFVDAGYGTQITAPITGTGAHPNAPSSGWTAAYNAPLSADKAALLAALKTISNPAGPSDLCLWSDAAGAAENHPINCVSWVEAFAFCIWDGGYLPSEAEWNYAAMGGTYYWTYPWGTTAPDATTAVFGPTSVPPEVVGSKPAGMGRYRQYDLAGNVWEWYLDVYTTSPAASCNDCVGIDPNNQDRGVRGGGFASASASLRALDPSPYGYPHTYRAYGIGMRCARPL